jgi:hypothetical protein
VRLGIHLTHPLTAIVLCTMPLWIYGILCGSTGHDDSHITFWQAHTLLAEGQLLNYNGERLEQSSSLLAIVLTALLSLLTPLSIVNSGYLINLLECTERYCTGLFFVTTRWCRTAMATRPAHRTHALLCLLGVVRYGKHARCWCCLAIYFFCIHIPSYSHAQNECLHRFLAYKHSHARQRAPRDGSGWQLLFL